MPLVAGSNRARFPSCSLQCIWFYALSWHRPTVMATLAPIWRSLTAFALWFQDGGDAPLEDQPQTARQARHHQNLVGKLVRGIRVPHGFDCYFCVFLFVFADFCLCVSLLVRKFWTPRCPWLWGSLESSWVSSILLAPPKTVPPIFWIVFFTFQFPWSKIRNAWAGGVVIVYERKVKLLYSKFLPPYILLDVDFVWIPSVSSSQF